MGKRYLLDSNIIIYHLGGVLTHPAKHFINQVLLEAANLSVISKIELLSWSMPPQADLNKLKEFITNSNVINLNDDIVNQTIFIRKYYRKIKLPDAIIAATCISNNYSLVTRNITDFKNIDSLGVINPFDLN